MADRAPTRHRKTNPATGGKPEKKKKARLIAAVSESDTDLLYASGFMAPDPFVWLQVADCPPAVIVNTLEFDRAVKQCRPGVQVFNRDIFFEPGENDRSVEALLTALAQRFAVAEMETPRSFPVFYADALREAGVCVRPGNAVFFPERTRKSAAETEQITAGLRAGEEAVERVAAILRESTISREGILVWNGNPLDSETLRLEIDLTLLRRRCSNPGSIVACGRDGAQPHNAGTGPVRAGEPLVVDIFPRIMDSGYWGDITRTFVKGRAPEHVKNAFEAVYRAREEGKLHIRAGVRAGDVHSAAAAILEKAGFPTGRSEDGDYGFIHSLGHGVGLAIHEWPRLSAESNTILETGNILTVEPGLYYPEWGGVRLEDMVVVETQGCRCLNSIDTVLEIP